MRYCIPTRAAWTTWVEHSVGIDSLWFQNISGNWQTSMENARGNDMFRGKLLSTIKAYKYNVVHGRSFQKDTPPHPWTEEEGAGAGRGRRRKRNGEWYRYFFVHLFDYDYILLYTKLNKNRSTTTNSNYLIGYINEIGR